MKIIQGMKKIKYLAGKAEDLRKKVGLNCSNLTIETLPYPDTPRQIAEWIQAHHDVLKEILKLRTAIQRTNLAVKVTIEIGGRQVTQSIAAWIHRRRDLAKFDLDMYRQLTDRNLKETNLQTSPTNPVTEVRIRRFFDASERDAKQELYRTEPSVIDATLETVNAVTDLIEE